MSWKTCWNGHSYQGSSCPICELEKTSKEHLRQLEKERKQLEKELEKEREKIEEATREAAREADRVAREQAEASREHLERLQELQWEQEAAAARAAAEARDLIERQHVIRAAALAQQAGRLFESGLTQEALQQALTALQTDPECFYAYEVAVAVLQALGESEKARDLQRKQIASLRSSEYCDDSRLHVHMLSKIKDDPELLHALEDVFRDNAHRWTRDLSAFRHVLEALAQHNLTSLTREVGSRMFSANMSLALLALLLDFEAASVHWLTEFLGAFDASSRNRVLDQFISLQEKAQALKISSKTLELVRSTIALRYEQWRPEIEQALATKASDEAAEEAHRGGLSGCLIWPGVFLGIFVVMGLGLGRPFSGIGKVFVYLVFVGLCGWGAYTLGERVHRWFAYRRNLSGALRTEESNWRVVLQRAGAPTN